MNRIYIREVVVIIIILVVVVVVHLESIVLQFLKEFGRGVIMMKDQHGIGIQCHRPHVLSFAGGMIFERKVPSLANSSNIIIRIKNK